jgi:uncharacterized RDD family membrane protein YckC
MMSDGAIEPTRENTAVVVSRVFAQLIDFVAYVGLIAILSYVIVRLRIVGPEANPNVILLPTFLAVLAYNTLLEAYWNGQTPGKRAPGIRVVDRRGINPSLGRAVVRNIPSVITIGGRWQSSPHSSRSRRLTGDSASSTSSRTPTSSGPTSERRAGVGQTRRTRVHTTSTTSGRARRTPARHGSPHPLIYRLDVNSNVWPIRLLATSLSARTSRARRPNQNRRA